MSRLAIVVLAIGTVVALALVPGAAWGRLDVVTTYAIYGYLVALVGLTVARVTERPRRERMIFAVFLASMPLVYLGSVSHRAAVWPELAGLAIFAGIAIVGYRTRPWLLAIGIAAHGAWDLAHLGAGPVPDWYALACGIIDVSLGIYAASRYAGASKRHGQ